MLCNQITNKRSEGLLALLFDKGPGNVAGHRIRTSCTHRAVNSGELLFWEGDSDFRGCHTGIIPSLTAFGIPVESICNSYAFLSCGKRGCDEIVHAIQFVNPPAQLNDLFDLRRGQDQYSLIPEHLAPRKPP